MKKTTKKLVKKTVKKAKEGIAIAVLTFHGAPLFSPERKKEIAKWLRRQGAFLLKGNGLMANRFTARYIVPKSKKA